MKSLPSKNRGVTVKGDNYECTCTVCEQQRRRLVCLKGYRGFTKGKILRLGFERAFTRHKRERCECLRQRVGQAQGPYV